MLQKIKSGLIWAKDNIVLVLGAVVGILLFIINLKNKKINALSADIALADTQKKADLIEADIKSRQQNRDLTQKELDELNQAMVELNNKRAEIAKQQADKTPDQVEDYWNK